MEYDTCLVDVNAICYWHGCKCSVTCMTLVNAVCYLHGGCYCSMLLA